ncbi:YqeB family protein [Fodinicola feengrottensis]|uniref:DUF308 domain-containing protein n=1 Tax=Fodinicola feengrottensis TaxID=435914 RepID=A0ABN2J1N8_9ACTN|nr:hypothetical protein [Fodinicola feengrottensis]
MDVPRAEERTSTVVSDPGWLRIAVWLGCPLAGALAGWGVHAIAGWVASLAWVPLQGPFKLIASIPQPYGLLAVIGLGVAAGLVLAYLWVKDLLTITVSTARVTFQRGESERSVDRAAISAVFLDGKQIVILGSRGAELAREKNDLSNVQEAFVAYDFPWRDGGDPYAGDYRRWVPDEPTLPLGANALLAAREKALSGDHGDDAAELRADLGKIGVVVRDEKKRQYWRLVQG